MHNCNLSKILHCELRNMLYFQEEISHANT